MRVNEEKSRRREIILMILSVFVGLSIPLVIAESVLRFFPVRTSLDSLPVNENHTLHNFSPNREFIYSKGWNFSIVNSGRVNNYGFVSGLDYDDAVDVPPLVAVVGDSYIEALMVPYEKTMHGRLASHFGNRARVYSFGSSGSPLSQYLVYAEYASKIFSPDAIVFLVVSNDFDESLLKYSSYPALHYFVEDSGGGLTLSRIDFEPSLLGRVLSHSALARYAMYNLNLYQPVKALLAGQFWDRSRAEDLVSNMPRVVKAQRIADSRRAIDAFFGQLSRQLVLPADRHLFILDGMRPNPYSPEGRAAATGSYHDLMRQYFSRAAQEYGYEVIDMQQLFIAQYEQDGLRFEFPTDAHWSGHGHAVAARAVATSRTLARALGTPD